MGVSIPNDDEFPDHAHETDPEPEFEDRESSAEDFTEDLPDDEEE